MPHDARAPAIIVYRLRGDLTRSQFIWNQIGELLDSVV